jgi:light-regulated signal transduction histidine kinase (bacteriophytochrome)
MQFPLAPQGFHQRVSVDKNLPSLPLDPDAIEQAILNLLANTMKYSGVSRDIELRVAARDSNAVIEVADHGLIGLFTLAVVANTNRAPIYIEPRLSPFRLDRSFGDTCPSWYKMKVGQPV